MFAGNGGAGGSATATWSGTGTKPAGGNGGIAWVVGQGGDGGNVGVGGTPGVGGTGGILGKAGNNGEIRTRRVTVTAAPDLLPLPLRWDKMFPAQRI